MAASSTAIFGISEAEISLQLKMVQKLVAQPVPTTDPNPSLVGDNLFVGNKHHAANVKQLLSLGVTAVLNCAPSGIRNLPVDGYTANGIQYAFTNVAQDAHDYPILHTMDGTPSEHLNIAKAFYNAVQSEGGKALFFCVAGQNRSATLAVAVQLARGHALQQILTLCSKSRPFMLENVGFQRQLVQLESLVRRSLMARAPSFEERVALQERSRAAGGEKRDLQAAGSSSGGSSWPEEIVAKRSKLSHGTVAHTGLCSTDTASTSETEPSEIMVELLVPGLRAFNVTIPSACTIDEVRNVLVGRVDRHFGELDGSPHSKRTKMGPGGTSKLGGATIGKAWLLFNTFGSAASECGLILEEAVSSCPNQRSNTPSPPQRLKLSLMGRKPSAEAHGCFNDAAMTMLGFAHLTSGLPASHAHRPSHSSQAVEAHVQLARLAGTFGLEIVGSPQVNSSNCLVRWDSSAAGCRFELVIFSILRPPSASPETDETECFRPEEPFTFTHIERQNAPGTLLGENIIQPYLRAWDFVTGETFRSISPIVFSFSEDPKSRRDFMNIR